MYAVCRELADTGSFEITLPLLTSKEEIISTLLRVYPNLQKIAPQLAVAVNNTYVQSEIQLNAGDEISIIPPVSGG